MRIDLEGSTLRISEVKELGAATWTHFRDQARHALTPDCRAIEVDLSDTTFLDSSGLGALVALHKSISRQNGTLRLLKPQPPVLQLLELTRMHRIFEIVKV